MAYGDKRTEHVGGKTKDALRRGQQQHDRHHGTPPPQPKKGQPFESKQTPAQCPDTDSDGM